MNQLQLLRPEWLLALFPLALLLWWLHRQRLRNGRWQTVCDPALLPFLLTSGRIRNNHRYLWMIGLAGLLAILALSGPAWEKREQPVFRENSALVILLDLSRSMDVADLKPNRLTRARHKLLDILKQRKEGQTALIVYAAQPFVVTPLTEDTVTIASQVNSLTSELMPSQGSRPDLAVEKGLALLQQAGMASGTLLLITDGIDERWAEKIVTDREKLTPVSILAVGTDAGAPIPAPGGGFVKDRSGAIVIPHLNREVLQRLAVRTGGRYALITVDDRDIDHLLAPVHGRNMAGMEPDEKRLTEQWHEEGPWLLLLLLPIAAFAFRRGYLLLLVALTLPLPQTSHATTWQDLWSRPDQQATRAMDRGDPATAAGLFEDREWQAAAHYRNGDYPQSLQALEGVDSGDGHYNRGNALARSGRLQEAIASYDEALKQNPEDKDAEANRDLLKKMLEQQQNDQKPSPQDGENQERKEDEKGEESQTEEPPQAGDTKDPKQPKEGSKEDPEQPKEGSEEDPTEQQQEAAKEMQEGEPREQPPASATEMDENDPEEDTMTEQWLRRIPDDPGGLLRRKFRYQYQQTYKDRTEEQSW